jgi:hypothetical protein
MRRSKYYIATIPMKSEEQVIEVKKVLEQIFGWVTLRGRHKERKSLLGNQWRRHSQNDIPWRRAQYIDVYLHHANPNRLNATGMTRMNMGMLTNPVRSMARVGMGYYDVVKDKKSYRKQKYKSTVTKLQPGDWGYYVQELIEFVERNGSVSHTELHNHYKKITGGSNSFSHCLMNLRNADPNRRCRRYIVKQGKRFCSGNYIVKYL